MSTALYEFMPYGAPEQIDGARTRLFRSTTWSTVGWILAFAAIILAVRVQPAPREFERTVIIPYRELAAPPPLTQIEAPPQIASVTAAAPTVGVPVPVPDATVPPEQTIASQEEISSGTGSVEGTGQQTIVVIEPPAPEELPKLGEFVYVDELPALVTDVPPRYPEIAREAGVEGMVLLRVLVGKNGRVMDVHVDQSMPMLDEAAVEAARQWVFTPALSNNHPVAVWITRRVEFKLRAPM